MTTPPPKRNSIQTWRAPSKQSPAQINVSRIFAEPQQFAPSTSATSVLESKLPPPSESLEAEETKRQKRERDPSPLNQAHTADSAASHQGGSTAAVPPLARQYSNKRVKRSADISESTECTVRRTNSGMSGGWFRQRGRQRPSRPKSMFEGVESDRVSIQSTTSVHLQPSEVPQSTPAPSSAPQTPPLELASSVTPGASGSQVIPIAIPLTAAINPNSTPSGSPARGGWFGSLRHAPPQPAKVQEPRPSTVSDVVSKPTHMDLDPPNPLPAARDSAPSSSVPPTRTGWFSKSVTSSPSPVQQSLPDEPIPPSSAPSLHVVEAPATSSSAEPVPAAITVNAAAARYTLSIPLLGRPKMKAQEVVVVEDLCRPLCSVSIYSTNVKSTY